MNTILSAVDAVFCGLVVVAAFDYLPRINPMHNPVLALSVYLVAIAAFGILASLLRGAVSGPFEILLHGGVVMYAWARRHFIFEHEWRGQERRYPGRQQP